MVTAFTDMSPHLDVDVWLNPTLVALGHFLDKHGDIDACIALTCTPISTQHPAMLLTKSIDVY